MRVSIRILIALQILLWSALLAIGYTEAPDEAAIDALNAVFLFGTTAMLLCFVPALGLARQRHLRPLSLLLAILPAVAGGAIWLFRASSF